jgi:hypothetical protein
LGLFFFERFSFSARLLKSVTAAGSIRAIETNVLTSHPSNT